MNTLPCVFIVDDDYAVRDSIGLIFETAGVAYQAFESAEDFLQQFSPGKPGCLLLDVNMPGMTGPELQEELVRRDIHLPVIFLTAYGDIPMTVRAIKGGAVDFLTKPVPSKQLLERIEAVLQHEARRYEKTSEDEALCSRLNDLTARELEVMLQVVEGRSSKEIARDLNISHRTVEIHRSRIMEKTGAANILELARLCEVCHVPPHPASG